MTREEAADEIRSAWLQIAGAWCVGTDEVRVYMAEAEEVIRALAPDLARE